MGLAAVLLGVFVLSYDFGSRLELLVVVKSLSHPHLFLIINLLDLILPPPAAHFLIVKQLIYLILLSPTLTPFRCV